jgi:2-polyprenyl-3-methyl-5-hydroxy-6-metoxy-1,4-benzoquinol methylase
MAPLPASPQHARRIAGEEGHTLSPVDVTNFVLGELPRAPSRVLEVGCGKGELARAMADAGYTVVAVDPDAPQGALFRRTTIEQFDDADPFDVVVASLSLHHVDDLAAALDKIAALLRRSGVLILDEFAWDRLDERSAAEVGIDHAEWRAEHADLHTAAAILANVGSRFDQRSFSWEPYLYREQRHAVSEGRERQLIEAGRLAATGFRYVGVRRS